ncbi:rab-GTPase-TBC domain-containing protein [Lophiotrema nucula]|uniref:Rab-GTPase-TBC domain-containing protein n=1 Tax=Lophiotrema nucula TaxID=690887 RepID=A0A6A5YMD9_9PLEO|nr:rab-GTPase-TBC domain-containing protein [Lophiotrema nucula]
MAAQRSSAGSPDSATDGDLLTAHASRGSNGAHAGPYRLPEAQYTPPASPQPFNPHILPPAAKSFGAQRSRHPADIQTDERKAAAYGRPTYSPSPSSSPPFPPSLPSPYLPQRQREAALLRQATTSSPYSPGPPSSPTLANTPRMRRQPNGYGLPSDPRALFNALGSNPVNQYSRENSWVQVQNRARGLTSSSNPYPPLRAATSIQDYGHIKPGERPNLAGTYKPNRGRANWTHNENSTVRPPRSHDDPRGSASWTNASSTLFDTSGTERSSMATGRSSLISENTSMMSKELPDLPKTSSDDDVDDVLDYYCDSPIEGYKLDDYQPYVEPEKEMQQETEQRSEREAYQELSRLPRLPPSKSRISRQDLAEFQAYSSKYVKKRDPSIDEARAKAVSPVQAAAKPPDPFPKVDEDVVRPRRASTSVFDRRSIFLDFGKSRPPQLEQSSTSDQVNMKPTGKRTSARTAAARISMLVHERDRYGFKKATDKISVDQYNAWHGSYEGYIDRRRSKWVALMNKNDLPIQEPIQFPERSEKVKRYVRKGFPPEWRGHMWYFYSTKQFDLSEVAGIYPSLVARVRRGELNKDDREAIERDLDRTFPDNVHFRPNPAQDQGETEPQMIKNLREVLQCFALHNPHIGYCQSLNFIGGLLLIFLKDDLEKVFILMHIITKFHLPQAHARNLENTEVKILMILIKDYLPKVWLSINDVDVINNGLGSNAHSDSKFSRLPSVNIACTAWFMSMFINVLPIETVLRIWDSFFYEGPKTLFKYALAIFKLAEPGLRKLDPSNMAEICMLVQDTPRKLLDPTVLYELVFVKKAFNSVDNPLILQKRVFWREQSSRMQKDGITVVKTSSPNDDKKGTLRRKASKRFLKRK